MTKKQTQRREHIITTLASYGISRDDAEKLIRAEMTLHRWAEYECGTDAGWCIERDDATQRPYMVNHDTGRRYPIADREDGALRRISAILAPTSLTYYHQTDPRGASLYIMRPGDVPDGKLPEAYYSRGLCICGR